MESHGSQGAAGDEVTVRVCGPQDVDIIRPIAIETYSDTFAGTSSDEDLQKFLERSYGQAQLVSELQEPDSLWYLASVGGAPAAYLKLNFDDAQTEDEGQDAMEVQRLYVRKAFKRRGLGRMLMDMALAIGRERGYKRVWLGVWEHNAPAQGLYRSEGFVRFGEHAFYQGEDRQTDWLLARDL